MFLWRFRWSINPAMTKQKLMFWDPQLLNTFANTRWSFSPILKAKWSQRPGTLSHFRKKSSKPRVFVYVDLWNQDLPWVKCPTSLLQGSGWEPACTLPTSREPRGTYSLRGFFRWTWRWQHNGTNSGLPSPALPARMAKPLHWLWARGKVLTPNSVDLLS